MGQASNDVEDRGRPVRGLILLNHHLGSFNDSGNGVTFLKLKFVSAAPRNDALNEIVPDPNNNMGHDIAKLNLFYFPAQFVSS
jgi:hypothetical protein